MLPTLSSVTSYNANIGLLGTHSSAAWISRIQFGVLAYLTKIAVSWAIATFAQMEWVIMVSWRL